MSVNFRPRHSVEIKIHFMICIHLRPLQQAGPTVGCTRTNAQHHAGIRPMECKSAWTTWQCLTNLKRCQRRPQGSRNAI